MSVSISLVDKIVDAIRKEVQSVFSLGVSLETMRNVITDPIDFPSKCGKERYHFCHLECHYSLWEEFNDEDSEFENKMKLFLDNDFCRNHELDRVSFFNWMVNSNIGLENTDLVWITTDNVEECYNELSKHGDVKILLSPY